MRRGFGWAPDPWSEPHEETRFGASRPSFPDEVDHTPSITEVCNQGDSNSCVGQSFSSAIQLTLTLKTGAPAPKPSPLWVWNMSRLKEGSLHQNVGIWPTTALRILSQLGYPSTERYPFTHDQKTWHDKPDEDIARNAYDQRTVKGYRVVKGAGARRVQELCAGLAQQQIFVYGQDVDEAFCEHYGPDTLSIPKGDIVGKHAMAIVGYRRTKTGTKFRVLNSWGEDWGDGGLWWAKEEVILWTSSTDFIAVDVDELPSS